MVKVCLSGALGRMGQEILALDDEEDFPNIEVISCVDTAERRADFPEFADIDGIPLFDQNDIEDALTGPEKADVLVIFINDPDAVIPQARLAAKLGIAVVIGTTALTEDHKAELRRVAENTVVIQANNFSLGVNLLAVQLDEVARILPNNYQVEIIELHHKGKKDAPSGTAKMFAEVICEARGWDPAKAIQCGRSGISDESRPDDIIGIQAVRGGSIPGTHQVMFIGPNETIEFHHEAGGRVVFAGGALTAAERIVDKPAGWYTMAEVLGL